jgi:plasmid stabilization system protein ParE
VRHLHYTTSALNDLAEIAAYIAGESGSRAVAEAFVGKIRQRCAKLATLPGTLGTPRAELRPDIRSIAHQGYVIFFRYLGDRIQIVNVLEGHRDVDGHFRQ